MRQLYSLALYLCAPLIGLRLLWRAIRQPEYLPHLGERWGFYEKRGNTHLTSPLIWIHAVSVGETRAAQPLINALRQHWPEHQILLTCMTPTGRAAGHELYGDSVIQAYLPYDYPGAVDRFFRHFSPCFGVLMETEIWPNLLACANQKKIPVVLANARLSARSASGYGRFAGLIRPALASLAGTAAQTTHDGQRLGALGAVNIEICGNLKFDVTPPADKLMLGSRWREQLGPRPVWLAASTREGEEALILQAWKQHACGNALLIVVPRHPQRFDEVAHHVEQHGFILKKRSAGTPENNTQVWLGDSMGEMVAYYRLADLAFIGGSLLPLGGQNLIEAAACGCPVLTGPHTFNFQQATRDAIEAGAARRIEDADDLIKQVNELLAEPENLQQMRQAALTFSAAHRGATARTIALIARSTGPARH